MFSSSFGAIGIDWATGRKLQQVERDSQHASRCGKRETRLPETVATGSEPRTSLSSSALGFGSSVAGTGADKATAALSSDEFCCLEALLTSTGRTFNDVSVTDTRDWLQSGRRRLPARQVPCGH